MRVPKILYVIYVRLRTGSSVIHAVTGNRAEASREFRRANERDDKDKVWMEPFKRCYSNPVSKAPKLRKGEQLLATEPNADV